MDETILRQFEGPAGVVTLELNRPMCGNALNSALIAALHQRLQQLAKDRRLRVLVLRGAGRYFCSGADLPQMLALGQAAAAENRQEASALAELLAALADFPCPTLACAQGAAYGGGLGLLACCDWVIAGHSLRLALPEVTLGLLPATIAPYLLDCLGPRLLRRYLLSGEAIPIEQALACGLVSEQVEAFALDQQVQYRVRQLCRGGPRAQREGKTLLAWLQAHPQPLERRAHGVALLARLRSTDEAQQGITAFLERQPPPWQEREDV